MVNIEFHSAARKEVDEVCPMKTKAAPTIESVVSLSHPTGPMCKQSAYFWHGHPTDFRYPSLAPVFNTSTIDRQYPQSKWTTTASTQFVVVVTTAERSIIKY